MGGNRVMSLRSDVEALARALGVWRDTAAEAFPFTRLSVWRDLAGQMHICVGGKDTTIDVPTVALVMLGRTRGLRVDIGECPACNGTGDERAIHRTREAEAEARLAGWWCRGGNHETGESEWYRDCVACTIDGRFSPAHATRARNCNV